MDSDADLFMRRIAMNTVDGCHKTIYSRMGRLSWENFLGRIEHGGWDCQMTSIIEIYDDTDKGGYGEGICRDMAGDGVRCQLPDIQDQEREIAGGAGSALH